eukprot:3067261-Amphidinium_carterae.1
MFLEWFAATSSQAGDGKYTVKLYDLKTGWEDVIIDDFVPCDKHGRVLFAQVNRKTGCLWPLLLEKAIAKFVGSYEMLVDEGNSQKKTVVLSHSPGRLAIKRLAVCCHHEHLLKIRQSKSPSDKHIFQKQP